MSSLFRVSISSTDPEEVHEWLGKHYTPLSVRLSGNRDRFHARHLDAELGDVSASVYEDTMATQIEVEPANDFVLAVHILSGRCGAVANRGTVVATPGESFIYDPDSVHQVGWQQNLRMVVLRFDRALLARVAAERTGRALRGSLRFPLSRPLSPEKGRAWGRMVRHLTDDVLTNDAARTSPLIRRLASRAAAATLVDCFPNTAVAEPPRGGSADVGAMRRATAFIEEAADKDIDLTQIADAARVGTRALQDAFRRNLGTTPMAYLRRFRLERAHHELQTADPTTGVTVTNVAMRWGFDHPGQFAAEYHSRYGCRPSHTLCTS
jgi:AraC-like DNA-binding protein